MRALLLAVLLGIALTPAALAKEDKPKPAPVRGRVVTQAATPKPAPKPATKTAPKPALKATIAPTPVPPTPLPPTPVAPTPVPPTPEPPPPTPKPAPPAPTARPRVLQSAAVVIPTREPTVEPTREPEIIDVADDPNARSQQTPVPSPTPRSTATATPAPTLAPVSTVNDVVAASFEPMLLGGRIGLAAAGLAGAAAVALHFMRRKR